MDLHAYTKTLFDLLSINKKYVVPRFQREYSWGEEEVSELWKDLLSNISYKDGRFVNQEYFIGSLVLVGEDKSTEFKIVDGQQRLTTLTLLLSALVEAFKGVNKIDLARGVYAFIEGRDVSNKPFFKVENENPRPFLQNTIQNYDKTSAGPGSEEELNLSKAFDYFVKRLQKNSLEKEFAQYWGASNGEELDKLTALYEVIRDQALTYLKAIYITVGNEEEAYTIFETLNARGMNLSPLDLMKNEIFRVLAEEHPVDAAKFKWKALQQTLAAREDRIDVDVFVRHFWLSNYEFTTEEKIYKSFKRTTQGNKESIKTFLDSLSQEAQYYKRITTPFLTDWTQQEEKRIYDSLLALNVFRVTQVRAFLLALMAQRERGRVNFSDVINCVNVLENFHFVFSAITSSRASGLENKYSKCARNLRLCVTKEDAHEVINDLMSDLKTKCPSAETFRDGFRRLSYTGDETRHKRLIQYIFKKWEIFLAQTRELEPAQITLEHIIPESVARDTEYVGTMGNLLPLGGDINNAADRESYIKKIEFYKTSKLLLVKEFVEKYGNRPEWTKELVQQRTDEMASVAYGQIWKV